MKLQIGLEKQVIAGDESSIRAHKSSTAGSAKPKISIYVNYFGDTQLLTSTSLIPIQVGKSIANKSLEMAGDDTGDNISSKNPQYCELTGQYWVWKNDLDSTHIGSMHYRRLFDFLPEADRFVDMHGLVREQRIECDFVEKYGLIDRQIEKVVLEYDMLLPEVFDVARDGHQSLYKQYEKADFHYVSDLELAGEIIQSITPEYYEFFNKVLFGSLFYPNNMFVLKREIFDEYSEWIFKILFHLELKLDISRYNASEARAVGYIAERLFTVFVMKYKCEHPELKVLELRRIFVQDPTSGSIVPGAPETELSVVTVAASSDLAYVPQLGALIASVLRHAKVDRFVDFIVLDGGIGTENRRLLQELMPLHPNSRLSFIDMSQRFLHLQVHSYFPHSTFYRLALPDILRDRRKVLFLDTDVVVTTDISTLFETDLGPYVAAAVPDLVMRSFCALGVVTIEAAGGQRAANYLADRLRLGDKTSEYFQAGTILFDLEKMRSLKLSKRMQDDLARNRYWFLDQDVLNKHLFGKVMFLDNRWNVIEMDDHHTQTLTARDQADYCKSQAEPFIIHYAGMAKPWNDLTHSKSSYFWVYLRETHWYEELLFAMWKRESKTALIAAKTEPILAKELTEAQPLKSNWSPTALYASNLWRLVPWAIRRMLLPVGQVVLRALVPQSARR